jgi:hypothetical protein
MRSIKVTTETLLLRKKERESIGSHKRGDRNAEKHEETEMKQKTEKKIAAPILLPDRGGEAKATTTR